MKSQLSASSIVVSLALFLLSACDNIKIPRLFADDNVPPEVKAEPRLVTMPGPEDETKETWPMVGTVPFKPNDFSTKPVYNHYMNEMEYERGEAGVDKEKALEEDPVPDISPSPRPQEKY